MQTKQQIQLLLASAGISPNKRLGQNFLIDLNLMRLLIDSAGINKNDIVLEVGCGTGSLTQALAEKAGAVIVAELDTVLAKIANTQLEKNKNVEIINTDILEKKHSLCPQIKNAVENAQKHLNGNFLLVANLPYSVASPVMLNLITNKELVADAMYVTVQKEVAARMTAPPGHRHYGTLSILLTATGSVKTIRILKPTVFWPPPQVDSAMVSFVRSKEKIDQIKSMKLFTEVLNLFMQHRRKTLGACTKFASGNLANIKNWKEILEQNSIDQKKRPEQIPPANYIAIANTCYEYLNNLIA